MMPRSENILLTGKPGIGKTTIIKTLAGRLAEFDPKGFYTEEIRDGGRRTGFMLKTLDGKEAGLLAHTDIRSSCRVGKYGVALEKFDEFLAGIEEEILSGRLIMIDEIGKMECFSGRFRETVTAILSTGNIFIGTIAERGGSFMEEIRKRKDIDFVRITLENRDELLERLEHRIRKCILHPVQK
jgi:nucleoside-triphosphatase